jgi:hypothetical protein
MMRIVEENNAATGEWDEMAAVGALKYLLVEHQLCLSVHHDAPSKGNNIVESLRCAGEIVRRRDDGSSARRLAIKDVHDLLLRRWINARYWFIEKVDKRVCGKGPREEYASPLPPREFANLPCCKALHLNACQRRRHCIMIIAPWPTQHAEHWRASHHHHFVD